MEVTVSRLKYLQGSCEMAAEMARSFKIYIVNHGHPDGAARDRGFLVFNRLNVASFRGAATAGPHERGTALRPEDQPPMYL